MTPYAESVMRWGNDRPWKREDGKTIRIRQRKPVTPADLTTDGVGNLTAIALPVKEECFGRPETYVRHMITKPKDTVTPAPYSKVIPRDPRCKRCPAQEACGALVLERIKSDPGMAKALREWDNATAHLKGRDRFLNPGPSDRWGDFKDAVAARGPFADVNDEALQAAKKAAADERRKSDAIQKKNRRASRRLRGLPPSTGFIESVLEERDQRAAQLAAMVPCRTAPRFVTKLPPHGVELTADVWAAHVILLEHELLEHEKKITAGMLAGWLIANGRDQGMAKESLRVRMLDDLRRVKKLEHAGIWGAFEPDA